MLIIVAIFGSLLAAIFASYGGVVAERGFAGSADGRSHCVCGRQLTALDLIPVVSWMAVLGVARCCKERIPARYVITEASSAVIAAVAVLVFGPVGLLAAPLAAALTVFVARPRSK